MEQNTTGREPKITREVYKQIKSFNRQQVTDFCMDLYKRGYADGRNSVQAIDTETIRKAIAETPDIGPKRYAAITEKLDEIFKNTEKEVGEK